MKKIRHRQKVPKDTFGQKLFIGIIVFIACFLFFYFAPVENIEYEMRDNSRKIQQELKSSVEKHYKKYKFKYEYIITAKGDVPVFSFSLPIPFCEKEKQEISNIKISPKPLQITNEGINKIAQIKLTNLSNSTYKIIIEGIANVRTYDIYMAKFLNKNISKETNFSKYLSEEKYIEVNSSQIRKLADKFVGNSREEIVEQIYNYITNNIKYSLIEGTPSAVRALRSKRGKCTGLSNAMVALCRAKNIPARVVTGNIARSENQKHTWVEVYFHEYGWVTYDPTVEVSTFSYYHNNMLVSRERIEKRPDLYYIASIKDNLSPWKIDYEIEHIDMNKIYLSDSISIEEYTKGK